MRHSTARYAGIVVPHLFAKLAPAPFSVCSCESAVLFHSAGWMRRRKEVTFVLGLPVALREILRTHYGRPLSCCTACPQRKRGVVTNLWNKDALWLPGFLSGRRFLASLAQYMPTRSVQAKNWLTRHALTILPELFTRKAVVYDYYVKKTCNFLPSLLCQIECTCNATS